MSAERIAASSRVRFDVTGLVPSSSWAALRGIQGSGARLTLPGVSGAGLLVVRSTDDPAGAYACRLLVRPYLPMGVDHLTLDARGRAGPAGRHELACDEPGGAERGQGSPARAVPGEHAVGVGPGPGAHRGRAGPRPGGPAAPVHGAR